MSIGSSHMSPKSSGHQEFYYPKNIPLFTAEESLEANKTTPRCETVARVDSDL